MNFTFRPIEKWPRPFTKSRKATPFYTGYRESIELMQRELKQQNARNVVIQLALQASDIRSDGLPRANSRPVHPGVIVSFEGKHGAISMPCDAFTYWEANFRAIALSLEALRKVDRYGVTQHGEQYTGWAALPAPASDEREAAARFISEHSGLVVTARSTDAEVLKRAYQVAMKELHPDVPGGSHQKFIQLKDAFELLSKAAA